ncbi:hypothetical protein [Parasphingorhabdus sp.]|uniref:hypothetical protein n=1 Tax=Parasphingorhabdus sp. TaxID=2709688 RepID=UPI0030032684
MLFALSQLIGALLLLISEHDIWIMILPILFCNFGGSSMDVANRTILFGRAPEIRTRLMTIYIVIMFTGGGFSSWLGTAVYTGAGWHGLALLSISLATTIMALSIFGARLRKS